MEDSKATPCKFQDITFRRTSTIKNIHALDDDDFYAYAMYQATFEGDTWDALMEFVQERRAAKGDGHE